ncbi:SDR family NAD(P)-dependent oxidoreductase [Thalassotalea sp. HSM 43]|uniref:SDR family NAD(P)-dependent oxidoreductase n=1 Tax=Thalassotalea sp. HSM 43 TaxID=2552945 RepID=UPI0010814358|nr:SDR family NAD(P)-dependent oxidoreductase [Thalassotalea sp. HSM 43]QBY03655.1 SDR family NAD(P)-dependent oxidoreductase [Thalassotalea sp. HSM 43]
MKVLITGATSGIGLALAKLYAKNDHYVVACGRNQDVLSQIAEHTHIEGLCFDVTDEQQTEQALSTIDDLDLVIINAGNCEYIDDVKSFSANLFRRVLEVNTLSVATILQTLLPGLSSGTRIVFVSSSVTKLPLPRAEAYGASKAAMDYLANSLRIDLHQHGIDVTLVHPGFIKTPLTDKNNFAMPFLMTSDEAATRIYNGVSQGKHYLQFPRRLTWLLSLLSLLPTKLWTKIACRS